MAAVGFELYCEMLAEAVEELSGTRLALSRPVRVDAGVDAYVPPTYVPLESTKIDIHRRIALAGSVDDLRELRVELADRFGPPPEPVENLLLLQEARLKLGRLEADYVSVRGSKATIGKLVLGPSELRSIRNEMAGAAYVSAAREVTLKLRKPGAVKEVLELVDAIVTARRAT